MIAVLMMAHGTPDSLDQMEDYLTRVRGGRPPSPELLREMVHNYEAIGGRSPLTDLTRAQARAVESDLGAGFRVFVGMRNWHPLIEDGRQRDHRRRRNKMHGDPDGPAILRLECREVPPRCAAIRTRGASADAGAVLVRFIPDC